jgi:hypothetical protein
MPVLIAALLSVALLFYLMVFVIQVALVLAIPFVLGGGAFLVLRAYYCHGTRKAVEAKLADLVGLNTSTDRMMFSARPDPELFVLPNSRERVVLGVVPWCGAAGALYALYELHVQGELASRVPWPPLVPETVADSWACGCASIGSPPVKPLTSGMCAKH